MSRDACPWCGADRIKRVKSRAVFDCGSEIWPRGLRGGRVMRCHNGDRNYL